MVYPLCPMSQANTTSAQPAVSIVIPLFNEVESLPTFTRTIRPVLDTVERRFGPTELVLVDDGSSDGTGDALRAAFQLAPEGAPQTGDPRVRIITHPQNRGLGAAIKTGFAAARGDIVVTTDADGTYDFAEIPSMLELMTPEVDLVTASPYHPEGSVEGVPAYRLILSKGASLLYRGLLDTGIYTYTAMFRAYRRRVLLQVTFQSNGYLSMAELMAEALLAGFVVAEFPAVLRVRQYGQSKAKVARIIKDHLRFQAGLLLRSAQHRALRLWSAARGGK